MKKTMHHHHRVVGVSCSSTHRLAVVAPRARRAPSSPSSAAATVASVAPAPSTVFVQPAARLQRRSVVIPLAAAAGGDGGSGGGGSSGGSGGGGGGGNGGSGWGSLDPRLQALIWAFAGFLVGMPLAWWATGSSNGAGGDGEERPVAGAPSSGELSARAATKEDVMALKRLLREAFSDALALKGRVASLEGAASRVLEAGDAYAASVAAGGWDGAAAGRGGAACGGLPFRAPLRAAGAVAAAATAVWAQGAGGGAAAELAGALGARAEAGGALWLHSLLEDAPEPAALGGGGGGGGKESGAAATAELAQAPTEQENGAGAGGGGGAATTTLHATNAKQPLRVRQRLTAKLALSAAGGGGADDGGGGGAEARQAAQLEQLLYRAEFGGDVRLLIAPLGGRLADAAPAANPHAPLYYGVTRAFRWGHGVGMDGNGGGGGGGGAVGSCDGSGGTGAALAWGSGPVSVSAGHFCAPAAGGGGGALSHETAGQVSLRAADGVTLSVLASARGAAPPALAAPALASTAAAGDDDEAVLYAGAQLPGVAALPHASGRPESAQQQQQQQRTTSIGVVAASPIGDVCAASAWVDIRPRGGGGGDGSDATGAGWGLGLHTQPDVGGQALGLALARPAGAPKGTMLCEVSARLPLADGLELSPAALFVRAAGGGAATALRLGAAWRF